MHRIIILLYILYYLEFICAILIQDQKVPNTPFGYIYNKPTPSQPVTIFPSYQTPLQSHPLSFFPTSSTTSQIQSSNQFHIGHIPQSIHLDIPPAVLSNFFSNSDQLIVTENGRLIRPYEVMERIIGDLEHPHQLLGPSPLLVDSFVSKFIAQNPNLSRQILHPITTGHGPIALGSGSLGYIQLRNGEAQLGSGSLGYISGQQASRALLDARTRKALQPPGPLQFGHSFRN
ncbi:uncharacterized protein LOC129615408 [Condylostylus longicornis]|uniref:uncharacterized protein LOC129615408 n=1 Tax=Condylostylus longicornis TaxID=2530218 RepID=UPI00244DE17D|nr:uncharacterized protein LOC129615408 [Condylostylus longicornis]